MWDRGGSLRMGMPLLLLKTRESWEAQARLASSWQPTASGRGEEGAAYLQEEKVTSSSEKIMGGRFWSGAVRWWESSGLSGGMYVCCLLTAIPPKLEQN